MSSTKSPVNFRSLTEHQKKEFLDTIDTVLTDCDGVLWNPGGLLSNSNEAVNKLLASGKRVFLVTNNSTKTKTQFLNKCKKLGFKVTVDNICSTAFLSARYLKQVLPSSKIVYVIGAKSISDELNEVGIESFSDGREPVPENILEDIGKMRFEIRENVGAVVVGFDQNINYLKLLKATTYLNDENCLFVATNTDESFPSTTNYLLPGTGAMVASVQTASGREPFVIGKPSTYVADYLNETCNITPERTLFIGDRCNTDILMGNKCCFKTLLVLSGVHGLKDIQKYQSSPKEEHQLSIPGYYTDSISDLILN